jgi:hypothetical protein
MAVVKQIEKGRNKREPTHVRLHFAIIFVVLMKRKKSMKYKNNVKYGISRAAANVSYITNMFVSRL